MLAVGGAIEQAHLLARYAPVVDAAAVLALAEDPDGRDRPRVLEYEVINPVGAWLAEQAATGRIGGDGLPATLTAAATTTRTLTQTFLASSAPPARRAGTPPIVSVTQATTGPLTPQGARL